MHHGSHPAKLPSRRSIRLKGYDYASNGSYFLTIKCTKVTPKLGEIKNETVELTWLGKIVEHVWQRIPLLHGDITLDAYQVMPDHFHAILTISGRIADESPPLRASDPGDAIGPPPRIPNSRPKGTAPGSIGAIVQSFKRSVICLARTHSGNPHLIVWQRNYYERIIRDEKELENTRRYIYLNPVRASRSEL